MLEKVLEYLPELVFALYAVVSLFVSENTRKKLKEILNEMPKLRKANYRESGVPTEEPQSFSETVKESVVDKATDKVVFTGSEIDLQKVIQSCAETALTKVLAKFLPDPDGEEKVSTEYYGLSRDLEALTEMHTKLSSFKQYYGMPEESSLADMQALLNKRMSTYKDRSAAAKEKKDEEKKNEEESK